MALVREGLADLVLSGHDEHLMVFYNGRTALTESESQADHVVVTTITLDKTREGRQGQHELDAGIRHRRHDRRRS